MAAARDRTRSTVAAVRASRRAAPIGVAGCALIAGVLLLGNPFATKPPEPRTPQPQIRLGAAELSLPEPTATASGPPDSARTPAPPDAAPPRSVPVSAPAPTLPKPAPEPVRQAAAPAPVFVVPPVPAAATPAPAPPATAAVKRIGGGKRATIIVEALPARPIIPPYVPRQPAGATPKPHPPLPLDTEIETRGPASRVPAIAPAPKTAAASLPRNG